MTQNPLGAHNHQRAAHRANRLTTQKVEDLGWGSGDHYLHIVLCTELQEALKAG